jgi:predicted transcriptional regulator
MARTRSAALTDGELRIMHVLWNRGRASVSDVVKALAAASGRPAYTTVLTMLRILERKHQVTHEKEGRAFVYVPLIDRGHARRSALSAVLSRFFDNSPELLVSNLLEHSDVNPTELQRIRALLDEGAAARNGRRRRRHTL